MAKVITVIKAYPEEGVEAEKLAEELRKLPECTSTKVVEIAFGAKAVMVSFVCEDAEMKDYESVVSAAKGVSEVQFEESGLL